MEPSRLPPEIFDRILGYGTDKKFDLRALCKFSLVSRQWHAALNARIYTRWSYNGEHHSISSLWRFLRSVLCSRHIADTVHELNIQNWTLGLVHERGLLDLSENDFDLIRNAISRAGLQRIENNILEALQKADPRPLMALLLGNLRNLTTIYAHLPETDIFFVEVLQKAVEIRQDQSPNLCPLSCLHTAHLTSAWNYRQDEHARDKYKLGLNYLWPIFHLPEIQRLSIFDLESLGASNYFGHKSRTSSVTDLTLVHHGDSILGTPDTLALLALPKALTKLSIYLNDCNLLGNTNQISNVDLWNGIRLHENSIEHLDIYRDCTGCGPPRHSANNSHFGSMKAFKRLKSLQIQPEILLGGCCRDDLAPFHLKDTLPPCLESLIVYGDEGLALNKTLSRQLQNVLSSTDFPRLDNIALEATFDYIFCYTDPADPPHQEVEQSCRRRNRKYETKQATSCSKGGIGRRYYQHVKEERLRMLQKLQAVRFALTEYLIDLRESTGVEWNSAVNQPGLSLEDLDTYELPWDELTTEALFPDEESGSEWDDEDPDFEELMEYCQEMADQQAFEALEGGSEDFEKEDEEYDGDSDGVW